MTRADILLDTNETVRAMEQGEFTNSQIQHVEDMTNILDKFWLMMLRLEADKDGLNRLGKIMRRMFDDPSN